jgi:hypothetical protein
MIEEGAGRIPIGATYFARRDGVIGEILRDLDIRIVKTLEDAQVFTGHDPIEDFWNPAQINRLPIPPDEREAFRRFRDMLQAMDPLPSYPLASAREALIDKYDRVSADEFVAQFGSATLLSRMNLYARSVLGAPLKEVNSYSFLNAYSVEFGDEFEAPCYTFPEGLAGVTGRLAASLDVGSVIGDAVVARMVNEKGEGVSTTVATSLGMIGYRSAVSICAVPKAFAAAIIPDLAADQHSASSAMRYCPYVTVMLSSHDGIFLRGAFDYWIDDPARVVTDVIDIESMAGPAGAGRAPNELHRYLAFVPRPAALSAELDDEAALTSIAQAVVQSLDGVVPGAAEKIDEAVVCPWLHSMVIPTIGSHTLLAPTLRRAHGRVLFAGADVEMMPTFENAVLAGIDAADHALRLLG